MTSVASADIARLAEALRTSGKQADVTTMDVLVNSSNYLKAEMEARVPVRTGRLRQSIAVRQTSESVTVGPNTEYAGFVEFGTKPHIILPKKGKALAFMVGGQAVVVKKVNHPGTRAQPYVRPAFESWVDTLGGLVAEAQVEALVKRAQ